VTGLQSNGRGFDFRSDRYQVVITWMDDCLQIGKPSQYISPITRSPQPFIPPG